MASLENKRVIPKDKVYMEDYTCPMCRQLANSVLPILPDMEGQMVRSKSQCAVTLGHEITGLIKEPHLSSQKSTLVIAKTIFMEKLSRTTYSQYRPGSPHNQAMILFVSSITRTNLELELVNRGGSLMTNTGAKPSSWLLPLLHVLGIQMKLMMSLKPPVWDWCQVRRILRWEQN